MALSDCIAVSCITAVQAHRACRHSCPSSWRRLLSRECLLQGCNTEQLLQKSQCCCWSGPRSSCLGLCWPRGWLQTGNADDESCPWRANARLSLLHAWGAGSSGQGWRLPLLCAGIDLRACRWCGCHFGCWRGMRHGHSCLDLNARCYLWAGCNLWKQRRQGWLQASCMQLCAHRWLRCRSRGRMGRRQGNSCLSDDCCKGSCLLHLGLPEVDACCQLLRIGDQRVMIPPCKHARQVLL
jgi:hypothetical protein